MPNPLERRRRPQHSPSLSTGRRLSHHGSRGRSPPRGQPPSSHSTTLERHSTSHSTSSTNDSNDRGSASQGMPGGSTSHAYTGSSRALNRPINQAITKCCRLELKVGGESGKTELKELRKCVARIRRELRRAAKTKEMGKGKEMREKNGVEERVSYDATASTWSCPISPQASTSTSTFPSSSTTSPSLTTKRTSSSSNPRSQDPSTSSRQATFTTSSRRSVTPSPTSPTANTFTTISSFPLSTNLSPEIPSLPSQDLSADFVTSSSASSTEASPPSSTAATSESLVLSPSSSQNSSARPTSSSTPTALSAPEPSVLISESNNSPNSAAVIRTKVIPSVICGTLLLALLLLLLLLYRRRRRAASLARLTSIGAGPSMSQIIETNTPGSSSAGLLVVGGVSPQHTRSSEQLGIARGGADVDPPSRATRVRRSFLAVIGGGRGNGGSASGSSFGGGRSSYGNASGSEGSLDRGVGGYNSHGGYPYDQFGAPHSPASGWTSTSSLQTPVLRTDGFPLPPSFDHPGSSRNDQFMSGEVEVGSAQEVVEVGNGEGGGGAREVEGNAGREGVMGDQPGSRRF